MECARLRPETENHLSSGREPLQENAPPFGISGTNTAISGGLASCPVGSWAELYDVHNNPGFAFPRLCVRCGLLLLDQIEQKAAKIAKTALSSVDGKLEAIVRVSPDLLDWNGPQRLTPSPRN
jgi:hypothetical protein